MNFLLSDQHANSAAPRIRQPNFYSFFCSVLHVLCFLEPFLCPLFHNVCVDEGWVGGKNRMLHFIEQISTKRAEDPLWLDACEAVPSLLTQQVMVLCCVYFLQVILVNWYLTHAGASSKMGPTLSDSRILYTKLDYQWSCQALLHPGVFVTALCCLLISLV